MTSIDHAAQLRAHGRRFATLVVDADPSTPVDTCPGWTMRNLATHVGRGDRWAAAMISQGVDAPISTRSVAGGRPPDDPAEVGAWLQEGVALLLDAVTQSAPGSQVWTFVGPRPPSWWVRRRLHESVVHGIDAALATGVAPRVEAAVAADGISEWLDLVQARSGSAVRGAAPHPHDPSGGWPTVAPLDPGTTLHLHATDEDLAEVGEWLIERDGDGIAWTHWHAKATVAVRGGATDLLLLLVRRLAADSDRVEVFGDRGVLDTWLDRTPF